MSGKPPQFDFKKTFIDGRSIETLHYSEAKRYLGKKLLNSKMKFNRTNLDDKGREIQVKTLTTSHKKLERWRQAGELITEYLENGKISAFVDDPRQPSQVCIVPCDIWITPNFPTAGTPLVVQGWEWKTYTRFNGEPYYFLISDLDQIAATFNGEMEPHRPAELLTKKIAPSQKSPKRPALRQFLAEKLMELYQADRDIAALSTKELGKKLRDSLPNVCFAERTLDSAVSIFRKSISEGS